MTNAELSQSARPLVEYIKIQIPAIDEKHAEILAGQLIFRLPYLFAERPELFSRALSMSGSHWSNAAIAKPNS
ncbi:MAG: hypothetical protein V7K67_15445 [Nostoc sp.]|uniref:hypothetical protein n=1 Tax=Nostoc sp. TaxID=1180 RepID=UPI002FF9EF58